MAQETELIGSRPVPGLTSVQKKTELAPIPLSHGALADDVRSAPSGDDDSECEARERAGQGPDQLAANELARRIVDNVWHHDQRLDMRAVRQPAGLRIPREGGRHDP